MNSKHKANAPLSSTEVSTCNSKIFASVGNICGIACRQNPNDNGSCRNTKTSYGQIHEESLKSRNCEKCNSLIKGDMVSVVGKQFHLNCFQCFGCNSEFTPGKRVTYWKDQFFCGKCFEVQNNTHNPVERMTRNESSDFDEDHGNEQNVDKRNRKIVNRFCGDPDSKFGQELAKRLAMRYDACKKHVTDQDVKISQANDTQQTDGRTRRYSESRRSKMRSLTDDRMKKVGSKNRSDSLSSTETTARQYTLSTTKAYSTRSIGKVASLIKLIEERVEQDIPDNAKLKNESVTDERDERRFSICGPETKASDGYSKPQFTTINSLVNECCTSTARSPGDVIQQQLGHMVPTKGVEEVSSQEIKSRVYSNKDPSPATPLLKAWPPVRPSPALPVTSKYKPTPFGALDCNGVGRMHEAGGNKSTEMLAPTKEMEDMKAQHQSALVERLLQRTVKENLADTRQDISPDANINIKGGKRLMVYTRHANKSSLVYLRRKCVSTSHVKTRSGGKKKPTQSRRMDDRTISTSDLTIRTVVLRLILALLVFALLMSGLMWIAGKQFMVEFSQDYTIEAPLYPVSQA